MTKPDRISIFEAISDDWRAEALLAELEASAAIPPAAVRVRYLGNFQRRHERDIVSVKQEEKEDKLELELSREGIYDALPEMLFHPPASRKSSRTLEEQLELFRLRREEEVNARKFFAPLESELFRSRFAIAKAEGPPLGDYVHWLADARILELCEPLGQRALEAVFSLLPLVNKLRSDTSDAAQACSQIVGNPVAIHRYRLETLRPVGMGQPLGRVLLGFNLTLWGEAPSGFLQYEIEAGPVHRDELPAFLEGGVKRKLLEALLQVLLPAEAGWIIRPFVYPDETPFELANAALSGQGRLGYTTVIHKMS